MKNKLLLLFAKRSVRWALGSLLGLVALYFLLGYFAVDPLAKRLLPWVAERQLASRMSVGHVRFDPLRLQLTVDQLRLARRDGAPLAGFERLYLDLEADGLLHRAWHLHAIRLSGPSGTLEIGADGKLNWAELIAKLNEDKKPDDNTLPRLVIDHLVIEGGSLHYAERNRPKPFTAALSPLALELDGFSTLPQDRGDYLIAARMPEQGATLRWKGSLGVNPLASAGAVEIEGLKLPKLAQFIGKQSLPVAITDGRLGAALKYDFAMVTLSNQAEPQPRASLHDVTLRLQQLAAQLNPQTVATLGDAEANLPDLDLALAQGGKMHIQNLSLHASDIGLQHESKHLLKLARADFDTLGFDLASNRLDIGRILLQQGEVTATRARDGTLDWQSIAPAAETAPEPAAAPSGKPLQLAIGEIKLAQWQANIEDQTFVHPLTLGIGHIDTALALHDDGSGPSVDGLQATLTQVSMKSALQAQPVASLAGIELGHSTLNVAEHEAQLSGIVISGLQTAVTMDAKHALNWSGILQTVPAQAATPAKASGPSWNATLKRLRLQNAAVHIEDASSGRPVALDVQNGIAELRDVTLDLAKPIPLKAGFQLKQGGRFDAAGKLAPAPLKADLDLKLQGLPLAIFSPYLNQHALLKLTDGNVGAHGKLAMRSGKKLNGQFTGGFAVNNLAITEEVDNRPFLSWQSVASDSVRYTLAPAGLHIDELRIDHPTGRLIIFEDKSINVQRMLRPAATPASPPEARPDHAEPFAVALDRLSISGADLEFADLSLLPQFGAHVHDLTGVINGLTTDPAGSAQVELDGKVDDYGSARVRGALQPFRATDNTDLKVAFRNLEMSRLTPYSGKFAGRKIDSGKLSVDLEYKIKNRQLAGANKFVINSLKLGERVESRDAVNLPLDLAIALLEDSNGVIDLDLPIAGSLDDPQFSYGKVVWKAIVNVISKIATAPFRALGKLLGISSEKLEAIAFDPGASALAPPEQEKLKALADAMTKRPALSLHIVPAYDPAADKAALQETATRAAVLKEMGVTLKAGEQAGPIDLANVKVQAALDNLYKDLKGEPRSLKAVDAIRDYFRKSKPEDLPRYTKIAEELKAAVKVSDADLAHVASARAEAIRSYLTGTAGLPAERITLADPVKAASKDKGVPLKLELGVAKPAR